MRAASAACAFSVVTRASAIMFMLVGEPVSGSRTAGKPLFAMKGPTPKFECVRYLVFATGRGRRYTDTVGRGDARPCTGCVLQPVGSRTTSSVNSTGSGAPFAASGGHGSATRIRPRVRSNE